MHVGARGSAALVEGDAVDKLRSVLPQIQMIIDQANSKLKSTI